MKRDIFIILIHGITFICGFLRNQPYVKRRSSNKFTSTISLKVIVNPNDSYAHRKPRKRKLYMSQNNEDKTKKSNNLILDYNWRYGICTHRVAFEGAQSIRRFKFIDNLLAFSFIDGKVCILDLVTSDIINKFNEHDGAEVTGLDFNGKFLCSGGADGTVCIYHLPFSPSSSVAKTSSKKFENATFRYPDLHNNAVTGLKMFTKSRSSSNNSDEFFMVSCSLDKKLICIDCNSGEKVYEVLLPGIPLCMDLNDGYIGVGLNDGRVIFYKASTGAQLLFFHTKYNKVRSIFMNSSSLLFTGSDNGKITRWDLSGGASTDSSSASNSEIPPINSNNNTNSLLNTLAKRPTRLIDYYYLESAIVADNLLSNNSKIKAADGGINRFDNKNQEPLVYYDESTTIPVVSLQADDTKILAAYADGNVRAWDAASGRSMFDLKGRNKQISTLQFDDTRLIADGTYSAVVLHDFSQSPSNVNNTNDEFTLVLDNYGDDSGVPSATS